MIFDWLLRDPNKPCRSARKFGDIFRAGVKKRSVGWSWERDMRPWMAEALGGAKFGNPDFDWSPNAADQLAQDFLSEASTW